jgi:hypothetical protein
VSTGFAQRQSELRPQLDLDLLFDFGAEAGSGGP